MVAVPSTAFKITKGTPKFFTTIGAESGKEHPRFFCGSKFSPPQLFRLRDLIIDKCGFTDCGSSLYSQPTSMPDMTIIRGGGLNNGADDIQIGIEFFTKNRKGFMHAVESAKQAKAMS